MPTFCSPSAFPTYASLAESMRGLMPATPIDFPGFEISFLPLPSPFVMPTMPSIPWPTMASVNAQLEMLTAQIQSSQLLAVVKTIYDALSEVISDFELPEIPGLFGLSFDDLLSMDPAQILASIKAQLPTLPTQEDLMGLIPDFDFSGLLAIPDPFFPTFKMPDMEILKALQLTIASYFGNLAAALLELANDVLAVLDLSGVGALELPAMPTWADIRAMLPSVPTVEDLKNLVFGPFDDFQLVLPDPLIPGLSIPEYDFVQALENLFTGLGSYLMQTIADFVENDLNISLSLPVICLPIEFSIPTIPTPNIPDLDLNLDLPNLDGIPV